MNAGRAPHAHTKPRTETAHRFFEHASAPRVLSEAIIVEAVRAEYPSLRLTVVPQARCDILAYAAAGHAAVAAIDDEKDRLTTHEYIPPSSRLSGGSGVVAERVSFGKYLVDWQNTEYVLYIADGRDGGGYIPRLVNQYILSPSVDATTTLLLAVGAWGSQLQNEVWVFDGGFWQKSAELWDSVQKARWEDVILDEHMKATIINDVDNFFNSRETYERLRVPWKRGLIYYGPPGNGKTISIKAMMNSLYKREKPVLTLYVRSLSSFAGPEYSLNAIFTLARREAPCLLVFEDLDSIVNDRVRSYFLNEVDGIRKNDGILMIGSTNHLERLDPGISKRPSRFDRKYLFPNPNEKERIAYMQYWQKKLADNKDLEFPDKLCPAIARITPNFSFAYLQEAMVATLLAIATREDRPNADHSERASSSQDTPSAPPAVRGQDDILQVSPSMRVFLWAVRREDDEDPDLDKYLLWREIKKQVRILKEMMGDEKDSEAGAAEA